MKNDYMIFVYMNFMHVCNLEMEYSSLNINDTQTVSL